MVFLIIYAWQGIPYQMILYQQLSKVENHSMIFSFLAKGYFQWHHHPPNLQHLPSIIPLQLPSYSLRFLSHQATLLASCPSCLYFFQIWLQTLQRETNKNQSNTSSQQHKFIFANPSIRLNCHFVFDQNGHKFHFHLHSSYSGVQHFYPIFI